MRKHSMLLVGMLVVAGVSVLTTPLFVGADYPSRGVDYLHKGVADVENDPEFNFLWRANTLGHNDEFSGPIAVGDKVWIANKGDKIFRCLDLRTGENIWSYQLNEIVDSSPLWYDNKVYVGTYGSYDTLYCFNADNGDKLWQYDGVSGFASSSAWINTDNNIIYWCDSQYLRAFRYDNGQLLWSTYTYNGHHNFGGAYYNGICYSPTLIKAYGAENGSLLWTVSDSIWDGGITVDNENADNVLLYVISHTNGVYCVDAETGVTYWKKSTGGLTMPTVWENRVYTTGFNSLRCLNGENGDTIWETNEGYSDIYTSPVILPNSRKVVYAIQNGGWLRVRNADTGELLWQYYLQGSCFSSTIAVVECYIVISSDSGYLWCFGAGNVTPLAENLVVSNLDNPIPRFSAVYIDNDLGDWARWGKVQIGTSEGDNDVWASDWILISITENNQRCDNISSIRIASWATIYYAQIKFMDNAGNVSPWSDTVTFIQTNPAVDNLLVESEDSPQQLVTFSPEFSFRYTDNNNDNSSMVYIQVGTSAGGHSMWDNQQSVNVENGTTISITYAGTTLQRGVQYFWRVNVRDNENAWSDWSGSENFMICLPNPPENLRVENQISPQRLTTMTPNFSFCYTDNAGENSGTARVQVWKGGGGLSASENIYPSEDAYTDSENPDSNYGNENHLDVYCYEGTEPYKYAFLKFDLEGIPTWATINSATLRWYVQNTDYLWAYGYVGPVEDDSWTENTITWNSQPSISEGGALSEFDFEYSGWHSFDSTSYVLEQAAGDGVASIGIVNYYNVPVEESMVIASRENPDYAPYLEVSYEHYLWDNTQNKNVENNSIITATYAGENLQRGNTYFWRARVQDSIGFWSDWSDNENFRLNQLPTVENLKTEGQVNPTGLATFTPAFSWNYSDNDNDAQSNYQIQVGTAENDNSMWDNTGAALTQITYSGNALARGVTYHVRVRAKDNYEWGTWVSGTFKLSQSPTVTVGDRTIELTLLEAGDTPVIPTSDFTMRLTIRTSVNTLLIYYARTEGTPQIPAEGVAPFYFDISTTNPDAISGATITFNIPKSWVAANNIIPSTLVAWRNSNEIWQTLPSRLVGGDLLYYYLEATTSGFSLFGVSGQRRVVTPNELPTEQQPSSQTPVSDRQPQQVIFIVALGILITSAMLLISTFRHHKRRK